MLNSENVGHGTGSADITGNGKCGQGKVYFAQKQAQETIKKARRQRKRKLDEEEDTEDDPSYGAGLF